MLILERRLGRMIEINDKVNCSGCTACYAVCPQSAIEMKLDEEGFKYPWVDKNRCVECGLCNSVCPILNKRKIGEENTSGYIVQNKNDSIRLKSTSGACRTTEISENKLESYLAASFRMIEFADIQWRQI